MKKSIFSKIKILLIATLIIIVAGMVVLGVVGFNNTVDYNESYRLTVKAQHILENSADTMKEAVDNSLSAKGIEVVGFATETVNDGETLVYKLYQDVTSQCEAIKQDVDTALQSLGLTAEVNCQKFVPQTSFDNLWLLLAAGIALIAIFLYSFFMDKRKVSGGLATVVISVLSGILALALIVITRVPASPYWAATVAISTILGAILSTAITSRFNEALKNVGNDKLSYSQIAKSEVKQSFLRGCFVLGAVVLASALMLILGNVYVKFLGIQVLIAGISAVFSATCFTSSIWAFFKGLKKDRKIKNNAQ